MILANKKLIDIPSTHLTSFLDAVKPLFIDPKKTKETILSEIEALDYTPHMKKADPTAIDTVVAELGGQSKRALKEAITEVLGTSGVV